jgi:hypothetical protein
MPMKNESLNLFSTKSFNASKHGSDEEISSLMHDVFEDCKVICFFFSKYSCL